MMNKLIQLVKDINPNNDAVKMVSDCISLGIEHPSELWTLAFEDDVDKEKYLCIEYLSVACKDDRGINGSDPDIAEYCLCIIVNDDFVLDNIYFEDDITDDIAMEIKRVWKVM